MITDSISSFLQNTKSKFANSFFGSLIFVWLVRNWEIIYSIFNFDKKFTLNEKLEYIHSFYDDNDIWAVTINNIGWALLLMIAGHIFVILSKVLGNVVDHNIMPNLNKRTVSKLVTDKSSFDEMKKQSDEYADKFEQEKNRNRNLVLALDSQKTDFDSQTMLLNQTISSLSQQKKELDDKVENLKTSVNSLENTTAAYERDFKKVFEEKNHLENKTEALEKSLVEADLKINLLKDNIEEIKNIATQDFAAYSLFKDQSNYQNEIEKKLPDNLYASYSEIRIQDLEIAFFQFVDMIKNVKQKSSFNDELIEKLIQIGLLKSEVKKGYTNQNVLLTEKGKLIVELHPVLRARYDKSNLKK